MLHVITFQSAAMVIDFCKEDRVYPFNLEETIIASNYSEVAIQCYHYMYEIYNRTKKTNYDGFFWGFLSDTISPIGDMSIYERAADMIDLKDEDLDSTVIMDLRIPDDLGLITDFYNWTDLIFCKLEHDMKFISARSFDEIRNDLFDPRVSEKQVVFPYIDRSMISDVYMARELLERRDNR